MYKCPNIHCMFVHIHQHKGYIEESNIYVPITIIGLEHLSAVWINRKKVIEHENIVERSVEKLSGNNQKMVYVGQQ